MSLPAWKPGVLGHSIRQIKHLGLTGLQKQEEKLKIADAFSSYIVAQLLFRGFNVFDF